MSSVPFLDNVYQGKNNWWRYLLTILATWGIQAFVTVIVILIFFILLLASNPRSIDVFMDPDALMNNGLFILTLAAIAFPISFLVFYIFVRFIHRRRFISLVTTKSKINWKRILKGSIIWLAILGIFTVMSFLIDPASYKVTFNLRTFGMLLILSLIAFPIQASFEEVFFRGYLMQGFRLLSKKPIVPLIATSIVFGAGHSLNGTAMTFSTFIVLDAVIMGLMLGIITLGEGSIETATGIHIMNNFYVALMVNDPEAGLGNLPSVLANSSDPLGTLNFTIIAALITITIVFWNKKDKLFDIFR